MADSTVEKDPLLPASFQDQARGMIGKCPLWGKVCCGSTICCCSCALFLLALILPGAITLWLSRAWCQVTSFFSPECETAYQTALSRLPIGANDIPLGYVMLANRTQSDVINFTAINEYEEIVSQGMQFPAKIQAGEWWRGNELGFILNNPYYWSGSGIYPMSIALGITSKQHSAIRPFFDKAFQVRSDSADLIKKSFQEFIKGRKDAGKLEVPSDLTTWVHQVLSQTSLGQETTFAEAQEFVALKDLMLNYGTISQLIPSALYWLVSPILGLSTARDGVAAYIQTYQTYVESLWGDQLKELDCSPTPSCSLQLASGMWDAFYSAGGASVPSGIQAGLAIFYSTSSTNPSPGFTLPRSKALNFFWECLRFAPPVYGFPRWQPRPTCAGLTPEETVALNKSGGNTEACPKQDVNILTGFPHVNQWLGGERVILSLLMGQNDPKVWGKDADKFILRSLEDYQNKSVGFAEMAKDDKVDGGRANRDCPGKDLALLIGKIFFEEFNMAEWKAQDADITIDQFGALQQIAPFTLIPER